MIASRRRLILIAAWLVLMAIIVGIVFLRRSASPMSGFSAVPALYVNEQTCAGCHAQAAEAWRTSHHAQAMQPATDATVLGDFNDVTFTSFGITTHLFRRGEEFWVTTEGPDGKAADFKVEYTFGLDPLQQYLVALPNGRYQALNVAWDTVQQRWFDLYLEEMPLNDPLHWTSRHFTWNSSCAECHSTNLRLNYDLATDQYNTQWDLVSVGCQACHGPGSQHIAWTQKTADQKKKNTEDTMGLVVAPATLRSRGQIEICAPCHTRRYAISESDVTGEPFLDHFMPALLTADRYHADGQIMAEVFEYGSFVQSKMYQQGVICTDCHNNHTGTLQSPGNAVCIRCHQTNAPTGQFPTLKAKDYNTPEHHFHAVDTPAAQCVTCHMPTQNYMVVDPRRDHSMRVPRPDLSERLGSPNACTTCHTDQSAAWATEQMNAWYGTDWQTPHYGDVLAAGRSGAAEAMPDLIQLITDPEQAVFVRATALDLLRSYGSAGLATFQQSLTDADPLIRTVATQGVREVANQEQLLTLTPLLTDPVRSVRIEAAAALAALPTTDLDTTAQKQLAAALAEYQSAQLVQADHPDGYINLGLLYARQGEITQAVAAFQTAIQRDRFFAPGYSNLANIYYQQGQPADAEAVFRQGLAALPEQGSLAYGLGLLLVEQQRPAEALPQLATAARLLPDDPRVQYNYGLLLQQMDQLAQAETALQQAYRLAPQDPDILYALVAFYAQQEQWSAALPYAEQLTAAYPAVAEFQQLWVTVKAHVENS